MQNGLRLPRAPGRRRRKRSHLLYPRRRSVSREQRARRPKRTCRQSSTKHLPPAQGRPPRGARLARRGVRPLLRPGELSPLQLTPLCPELPPSLHPGRRRGLLLGPLKAGRESSRCCAFREALPIRRPPPPPRDRDTPLCCRRRSQRVTTVKTVSNQQCDASSRANKFQSFLTGRRCLDYPCYDVTNTPCAFVVYGLSR